MYVYIYIYTYVVGSDKLESYGWGMDADFGQWPC